MRTYCQMPVYGGHPLKSRVRTWGALEDWIQMPADEELGKRIQNDSESSFLGRFQSVIVHIKNSNFQ